MAKTILQLKAQGAEIKNATVVGENTATRVGTLFNDIVEHVEDYEAKQAQRDTKQDNDTASLVTAERERAISEEDKINKALASETARAKAAEEANAAAIEAEAEARTLAISQEAQARTQADGQLGQSIFAEVERAKLIEQDLTNRVDELDSNVSDNKTYTSNDLVVGYYYNFSGKNVGDTAPETPIRYTGSEPITTWGCMIIRVSTGALVTIAAKGARGARAYALTDNDKKIIQIAKASENSLSNPISINAEANGFLYINQNDTTLNKFHVEIHQSKIKMIENSNDTNTDDISSIKQELQNPTYYDKNDLLKGYYYKLDILSEGDTAPDKPLKHTGNTTDWGCFVVPVIKGAIITLAVKGGTSARAFAITDADKKILTMADSEIDTRLVPLTITTTQKGFLYVNQGGTSDDLFSLTILQDKFLQLDMKIETAENNIQANNDLINETREAILVDNFKGSDLQQGVYYGFDGLSIGDTAPSSPSVFAGTPPTTWGCIIIPVVAGAVATMHVKGANNGRAYALTDSNKIILDLARAALTAYTNPVVIKVQQDGFLYINQNDTTDKRFSVSIEQDKIKILAKKVDNVKMGGVAPMMFRQRIDFKKEQLRILDIGNSYTEDATHYLKNIVDNYAIDTTNICVYKIIRAASSFKMWFDIYHNKVKGPYYVTKIVGGITQDTTGGVSEANNGELFRNMLKNNQWDIIIIHQVSDYAPYYDSWEEKNNAGYLSAFLRIIKKHQPNAAIGFLLTHSYWSGYKNNKEGSSLDRWKLIADSANKISVNYGIDFIIPYGTAIQNIRASSLNNDYDLTMDGTHCADGVADYTASCAYFQSIFAPRYDVCILGDKTRISVSQSGTYPTSCVSVDNNTAPLCQMAAFLACTNMWKCQNPEEFGDENLI